MTAHSTRPHRQTQRQVRHTHTHKHTHTYTHTVPKPKVQNYEKKHVCVIQRLVMSFITYFLQPQNFPNYETVCVNVYISCASYDPINLSEQNPIFVHAYACVSQAGRLCPLHPTIPQTRLTARPWSLRACRRTTSPCLPAEPSCTSTTREAHV